MHPVVLPVLGANMSHGIVREWFKREGDPVAVGDRLFEVETDKINAEVEAEVAGVLRLIAAPPGTKVPVLGLVAFVGGANEPLPPRDRWAEMLPDSPLAEVPITAAPAPVSPAPLRAAGKSVAASPAARRLARERGVALDRVRPTGPKGEITRADVEAACAAGVGAAGGDGRVDPYFLSMLRQAPDAFRALPSEMKVHLYRRHGAEIGDRVRIDAGALILAEELRIGAGSIIGADSSIECERVHLGRLVAFGKRSRVKCRSIDIGDALWSKDDVVIGGGGSEEAGARLRAGDACFFGEGSYLNTCHPLTLGDEVCIGSRAMLFTHSHWQSILRGYPSLFGPIDVGDHVFIGNQAFVFPGVAIGAGATVTVNSFVALNVPPNTLVGGVPAQVIRHIVAPDRAAQVRLMAESMAALAAVFGNRGGEARLHEAGPALIIEVGGDAAVMFAPSWEEASRRLRRERTVVLSFAPGISAADLARGTTLLDLDGCRVAGEQDRLSDEVREFCRRRGIRFRPLAWRYGVGHFEGDRFFPRDA